MMGRVKPGATVQARPLLPGEAEGQVLRLTAPISFWGGVGVTDATIIDPSHPQAGICISGTILAIPATIGSSSSAAVLLELIHAGIGPAALILAAPDAILALGAIVAREMDYGAMPVLHAAMDGLETGATARIGRDGVIAIG